MTRSLAAFRRYINILSDTDHAPLDAGHDSVGGREIMIKIWGTQHVCQCAEVMWALGELGVPHERIDVGGSFGKNNEPPYLAMNPNGPGADAGRRRLSCCGNRIRSCAYLAAKYGPASLEPDRSNARARAGSWMDWQISVAAPLSRRCSGASFERHRKSAMLPPSSRQGQSPWLR
jgi:hypothetical protein